MREEKWLSIYQKWIDSITDSLMEIFVYNGLSAEELEIKRSEIDYKLYNFILATAKLFLYAVITLTLGIFSYALAIFAGFVLVRKYAYGLHMSTVTGCFIVGLIQYIPFSYLTVYAELTYFMLLVMNIATLFAVYKYAPNVDKDDDLPFDIDSKMLKKRACICTLIAMVLVAIASFTGYNDYANAFSYGMLIASIHLYPVLFVALKR